MHDVCDWTMRYGNIGKKVVKLQEDLIYLGYLNGNADGQFGARTADAVRKMQKTMPGKKVNGIADIVTQRAIEEAVEAKINADPNSWLVMD